MNEAGLGQQLQIRSQLFDIKGVEPLPPTDILVVADLLYMKSTSVATAKRCVEALRAGCRAVLVGDTGRPGRQAFLETLYAEGVDRSKEFKAIGGWSAGTERNEDIAPLDAGGPQARVVGLMYLSPEDLAV